MNKQCSLEDLNWILKCLLHPRIATATLCISWVIYFYNVGLSVVFLCAFLILHFLFSVMPKYKKYRAYFSSAVLVYSIFIFVYNIIISINSEQKDSMENYYLYISSVSSIIIPAFLSISLPICLSTLEETKGIVLKYTKLTDEKAFIVILVFLLILIAMIIFIVFKFDQKLSSILLIGLSATTANIFSFLISIYINRNS